MNPRPLPEPSPVRSIIRKSALGVHERFSAHYDENGRTIRHWKEGERKNWHWKIYEWRTKRIAKKRLVA